jgi:hypothetical protein
MSMAPGVVGKDDSALPVPICPFGEDVKPGGARLTGTCHSPLRILNHYLGPDRSPAVSDPSGRKACRVPGEHGGDAGGSARNVSRDGIDPAARCRLPAAGLVERVPPSSMMVGTAVRASSRRRPALPTGSVVDPDAVTGKAASPSPSPGCQHSSLSMLGRSSIAFAFVTVMCVVGIPPPTASSSMDSRSGLSTLGAALVPEWPSGSGGPTSLGGVLRRSL